MKNLGGTIRRKNKKSGWFREPTKHALASKGIRTKTEKTYRSGGRNDDVVEMRMATGFGDDIVQFREKDGNIEYRRGGKVKGKHWKESKFDTMEEAKFTVLTDDYYTEEQQEKIDEIMDYEVDDGLLDKRNRLRSEINQLESEMDGGIHSLPDEKEKRYNELLDERKEVDGKIKDIEKEHQRKKKKLKMEWMDELRGEI